MYKPRSKYNTFEKVRDRNLNLNNFYLNKKGLSKRSKIRIVGKHLRFYEETSCTNRGVNITHLKKVGTEN